MGDIITIGGSEVGKVCAGSKFSAGGFCVESFSP